MSREQGPRREPGMRPTAIAAGRRPRQRKNYDIGTEASA